jgi:hypothetical protein
MLIVGVGSGLALGGISGKLAKCSAGDWQQFERLSVRILTGSLLQNTGFGFLSP